MLSDACSDFKSDIEARGNRKKGVEILREQVAHYGRAPFDYKLGEIPALERLCDAVARGERGAFDRLVTLAEEVRKFHDTPPCGHEAIDAQRRAELEEKIRTDRAK
jgi:hypothetical protein